MGRRHESFSHLFLLLTFAGSNLRLFHIIYNYFLLFILLYISVFSVLVTYLHSHIGTVSQASRCLKRCKVYYIFTVYQLVSIN